MTVKIVGGPSPIYTHLGRNGIYQSISPIPNLHAGALSSVDCKTSCWADICVASLRMLIGIATPIIPTLVAVGGGTYHKNPCYKSTAETVAYAVCIAFSILHSIYSVRTSCCLPEGSSTPSVRCCKMLDPFFTILSSAITTTLFINYLIVCE